MSTLGAWDGLGRAWLAWSLERGLAGTIALAAVGLALVVSARLRGSAHLASHLLLVPLLVLAAPVERLLPGAFPTPLPALGSDLGANPAPRRAPPEPRAEPSRAGHAPGGELDAPALAPAAPAWSWPAAALAAWAGVVLVGLARLVWRQVRAERVLASASARPAPALRRRLDRLARATGVRPRVALGTSRATLSPLVCGFFAPRVWLPADLAERLSPAQVDFVLRHELAHVRRHDVLLGAFACAVQLAFWFHPAVWLNCRWLARWREYACDDAALARVPPAGRVAIADALLGLAERGYRSQRAAPPFIRSISPRNFMHQRLLRILDSSRRPAPRLTPIAAVLLVAITVGALTAARAQQSTAPQGRTAAAGAASLPADPVAGVLDEAVAWLLRQQQGDGSWAIGPDPSGANQRDHNEVCVTAMAIRALLPGLKDQRQKIAEAVRRATAFLERSQAEDGRFGPADTFTAAYAHGQALRALCAVQQEWPDEKRRERLERGVRYALEARNPYMGWRYTPRCGDNDSKITAMMLLGLHAAKGLGIEVEPAALEHPLQLLDQLTDPATGRTGFVTRGQTMSRFTSKKARFPGEHSEEPTALAVLARAAAGRSPGEDPLSKRGVELIAARPPVWDTEHGTIDLAYWEFGAQAMALVGGQAAETWREKSRSALVGSRIVADGRAHWPAIDAWSHPGMEAYATASAVLILRALR